MNWSQCLGCSTAVSVHYPLSRKLHEVLIDSWGCGEIQENGVEVLIKVFSTCTYCPCFPSIVSWASQKAGPVSERGCLKSTSKIFSWEVDVAFINRSTLSQRPSVLIAWLTSPPPTLWMHPGEDKPPALPAVAGHPQRALLCNSDAEHLLLHTFSAELPAVGSLC